MATFDPKVLDTLSLPLGDLIAAVGRGVAEAQREMDAASISTLQEIYTRNDGFFLELQRIGYRPTWYHIPEAEGDLQITLTATGQESTSESISGAPRPTGAHRIKLYASPVDAAYASRFGFTVQASSRVKFRIVTVPPSTVADELRVMPTVIGLTVGEARARLTALNIAASFPEAAAETANVASQDPPAGTLLSPGQSVTVDTRE